MMEVNTMQKLMMGVAVCALTLGLAGVQPASAASTAVNPVGGPNSTGNERCFIGTGGVCGAVGAFSGASSIQTILESDPNVGTLTRIDDGLDQLWNLSSGTGLVLARARYAGFDDVFGYVPGAVGGSFTTLLPAISPNNSTFVNAGNPNIGGDITALPSYTFTAFTTANPFRFAIQTPGGTVFTSQDSDNAYGYDHMVTLEASNVGDTVSDGVNSYVVTSRYIVGFEDLPGSLAAGVPGDYDYNDYVFELVNVKPVPVPAAIPLFLSGLAALGLIARRRKA
jgi:hypothetical protein